MGLILEIVLQFVFEFFVYFVGEVLVEVGLRGLAETFRGRGTRNPLLALIGYAAGGAALGGLSLLVFPQRLVQSAFVPGLSLVVTPLLTGAAMSGVGWLRRRQGKRVLRIDRFVYGAVFAFGMALVRFLFTS